MSTAIPGDPKIDDSIRLEAKSLADRLRTQGKNLDEKALHDVESWLHTAMAHVSKYRGVRILQKTAKPGGGRRKRP